VRPETCSGTDDEADGTKRISFRRKRGGAWASHEENRTRQRRHVGAPLAVRLPGVGCIFRGDPNPGLARENEWR